MRLEIDEHVQVRWGWPDWLLELSRYHFGLEMREQNDPNSAAGHSLRKLSSSTKIQMFVCDQKCFFFSLSVKTTEERHTDSYQTKMWQHHWVTLMTGWSDNISKLCHLLNNHVSSRSYIMCNQSIFNCVMVVLCTPSPHDCSPICTFVSVSASAVEIPNKINI